MNQDDRPTRLRLRLRPGWQLQLQAQRPLVQRDVSEGGMSEERGEDGGYGTRREGEGGSNSDRGSEYDSISGDNSRSNDSDGNSSDGTSRMSVPEIVSFLSPGNKVPHQQMDGLQAVEIATEPSHLLAGSDARVHVHPRRFPM